MSVEQEQVAQVLDEAAAFIDEHGWLQGSYYSPEYGACAVGGIEHVMAYTMSVFTDWRPGFDSQVEDRVLRALVGYLATVDDAVRGHVDHGFLCPESMVECWNDTPGRTKEDVVAAMQKAAIAAREKVE